MPVSNWTYAYMILALACPLCGLLAMVKHNERHAEIFAVVTPLMLIGFLSNLHAMQAV